MHKHSLLCAGLPGLLLTRPLWNAELQAVSWTVENDDPKPANNVGQREVMKISIVPNLRPRVASPNTPLITKLVDEPTKPLAMIPDLRTLYGYQTTKVEKYVMLMERQADGCPQGLAVSECKKTDGTPEPPDPAVDKTDNGWGPIPINCLKDGMPRNMFADGAPLTCKEGESWGQQPWVVGAACVQQVPCLHDHLALSRMSSHQVVG
jgi:hypothetical protein